jgi:predicted RNA-binding Zn-ribbon protein involved in translation (DUF1610 family)
VDDEELREFPDDAKCPDCGDALCYAHDMTEYYIVESKEYAYYDTFGDADNCRVFCPDCGEYFKVPETLETNR